MVFAKPVRSAGNAMARLAKALRDGARRDRAMLLLLVSYALLWTLYGCIAKSSQDLHPDMAEMISWSRAVGLGYPKHPPLGAWLVRLWFSVFPLEDWSFYLLAMLMPALALWIFWRLSADYLDVEKRIFGVVLLMVIPFYNFHALKYNANTLLIPAWAATTLVFLRSYRGCSVSYGALAGICAAVSMLAKYWSVFLLAGLIMAALIDPRRRIYFRSAAPWVTVAVGLAVLAPHLIWIYQHDFMSVQYAMARHSAQSVASGIGQFSSYFVDLIAYAAAPVVLVLVLIRPSRAAIVEMIRPPDREVRLVAVAFWGPLLLPVVAMLASGTAPTALWSMPAWTLLPVLMLSPPAVKVEAGKVQVALAAVAAELLIMLIAAPAIALAIHRIGVEPAAAHGRLLAADTEQAWRNVTSQPLRSVGCDMADEVVTYAKDRPRALPWRFFNGDVADMVFAEGRNWPLNPKDPQVSEAELAASGMALVCSADRSDWVEAAAARAARDPSSRRIEIEARRDFLGFPGRPARYVIFIIPPRT